MNDDLNQLVDQVRLATDYQTNKQILREKIHTELHMPFNGGLFKITPELLSFVATWPVGWVILEDVYQNPIEIDNTKLFLVRARQHYSAVMNDWQEEHAELKKIRKV